MWTSFIEEPETARLLELAGEGQAEAAGQLLDLHRERLGRMVRMRLDPRVRGRLGVSDVLQEACLEAFERMDEYLRKPEVPFYLWLRFIAAQRVQMAHRQHIRAKGRAVWRERPLQAAGGAATSSSFAAELTGRESTPSRIVARAEVRDRLAEAIEAMEPVDREVLALRHFEQLTNRDVARVLGLDPDASSKRYVRALRRLRGTLGDLDPAGDSRGGIDDGHSRRLPRGE